MSGSSPEPGSGVHPGLPRQPLGTIIFQRGMLSAEQLLEALEEGHRSHRRLGEILVERGWLDERELADALGEQYDLPVVELAPPEIELEAARLLSAEDSERLDVFVVRRENGAPVVAVSDPSNRAVLDELGALLGDRLRLVVATPSSIAAARGGSSSSESSNGEAPYADPVPDEPDQHAVEDDAADAPGFGRAEWDEPEEVAWDSSPEVAAIIDLHAFAEETSSADGTTAAEGSPAPVEPAAAWPPPFEPDPFDFVPGEADPPLEATSPADEVVDPPSGPSDAFLWAPEPHAESVDTPVEFGRNGSSASTETADSSAFVPSYELDPWPEAVAAEEHAAAVAPEEHAAPADVPTPDVDEAPAGTAGDSYGLAAHEADVAAAEAPEEHAAPADVSTTDVDEAPAGTAGDSYGPAAREAEFPAPGEPSTDAASEDVADSSQEFTLVFRLIGGETVQLGRFDDPDAAGARAEELLRQLRSDEPTGWTSIDGRYFRLQAIIGFDVAPLAD